MRGIGPILALVALLGVASLAAPALAQDKAACPKELPTDAECFTGVSRSGAFYWIARPRSWNGVLVLHAHGGPRLAAPTSKDTAEDLARFAVFVQQGYAWAGSSYRRGGYGVQMAARDTDALRRLYVERFGRPRLVLAHGQSWGANVVAKLVELVPVDPDGSRAYDGALLTSGVLAGGTRAYNFRADLRAVYQFYCRNHPRPDEPQYPVWMGLPADAEMSVKQLEDRIDSCTGVRKPPGQRSRDQAARLAAILKVVRIPERTLLSHMDWATFLFRDIVQKRLEGRGPFDNALVNYEGSPDDAALNKGVERFTADPRAVDTLSEDSDLTGDVAIPVLTLHAIDDPTAFVEHESAYRDTLAKAGHDGNLVQVFTGENVHSSLEPPEYATVIAALRTWVETGLKPSPASIAAACPEAAAKLGGACMFRPDYRPPPFLARTYPRTP